MASDKVSNIIAKSRLESEIQANRISAQNVMGDIERRQRIKNEVDQILNRY